jgi:hypothetical protein
MMLSSCAAPSPGSIFTRILCCPERTAMIWDKLPCIGSVGMIANFFLAAPVTLPEKARSPSTRSETCASWKPCCNFKWRLASFGLIAVCTAISTAAARNNPRITRALTGTREIHGCACWWENAARARNCAMVSRLRGGVILTREVIRLQLPKCSLKLTNDWLENVSYSFIIVSIRAYSWERSTTSTKGLPERLLLTT